MVGHWEWCEIGKDLPSHGAQGVITQASFRFPEEPEAKGSIVGAIRRVRAPKDGAGEKWAHLFVLGIGTMNAQRVVEGSSPTMRVRNGS